MKKWQPEGGFVFIVTYGRSGSTLLQTVLQSIDGYFIRGENNNALIPLFRSSKRLGEAKEKHGYREIPTFGPWFGADKFDEEAYASALCDVFVEHVLMPPEDARVIGFKEIRYPEVMGDELFGLLDFMAKHFKPAKFIFNTRDWQDVSKSGWWADQKKERVQKQVENADRRFKDYAEKHPDTCYMIKYEDYTADLDQLQGLFDFLGESFDRAVLEETLSRKLKH
ncbi:hypothetical protein GCM10017044_11300 [Kordiimonas sediminis]|uniref:Sulfotransferase family protein n=1 Tax=Kordiimonas sediminis TaxID=1735581 RepID=A0A919APT3_9PROT|nr:sulfotransferase [Kordiimonas sediminis]GHF18515.1 hypothetical protein GCM10017044_11300 [Kordiimonas sediminis]